MLSEIRRPYIFLLICQIDPLLMRPGVRLLAMISHTPQRKPNVFFISIANETYFFSKHDQQVVEIFLQYCFLSMTYFFH